MHDLTIIKADMEIEHARSEKNRLGECHHRGWRLPVNLFLCGFLKPVSQSDPCPTLLIYTDRYFFSLFVKIISKIY